VSVAPPAGATPAVSAAASAPASTQKESESASAARVSATTAPAASASKASAAEAEDKTEKTKMQKELAAYQIECRALQEELESVQAAWKREKELNDKRSGEFSAGKKAESDAKEREKQLVQEHSRTVQRLEAQVEEARRAEDLVREQLSEVESRENKLLEEIASLRAELKEAEGFRSKLKEAEARHSAVIKGSTQRIEELQKEVEATKAESLAFEKLAQSVEREALKREADQKATLSLAMQCHETAIKAAAHASMAALQELRSQLGVAASMEEVEVPTRSPMIEVLADPGLPHLIRTLGTARDAKSIESALDGVQQLVSRKATHEAEGLPGREAAEEGSLAIADQKDTQEDEVPTELVEQDDSDEDAKKKGQDGAKSAGSSRRGKKRKQVEGKQSTEKIRRPKADSEDNASQDTGGKATRRRRRRSKSRSRSRSRSKQKRGKKAKSSSSTSL